MIDWEATRVAESAHARLMSSARASDAKPGPERVVIDSRQVTPGDLFVGLRGEREDGGAHAAEALQAGAWGVLVTPGHAQALEARNGMVLVHPEPLRALQALASAWRRELGAKVVAITGSTGKTSTKDILAALLSLHMRTVASSENLNTEIGLPLAVLAAPGGTEALVLELAMRGSGQIAELTAIAQPDVGVIVNVGPVHLELLGSLQAVAAAKAELIAGLAPGSTVVLPAEEPLLAPYLREDLRTVTFGEGGDVRLADSGRDGEVVIVDRTGPVREDDPQRGRLAVQEQRISLRPSFAQPHNLRNLLAAVAAARALGVTPEGRLEVTFSALRGERIPLSDGIVLINDCYNANPMSMRAALDDLAATAPARRVAVLGDMLELGPPGPGFHREVGEYARERGVQLLLAVGSLAADMQKGFTAGEIHCVPDAARAMELLPALLHPGDTVLVKGSRGVELEKVAQALVAQRASAREQAARREQAPGREQAPRRKQALGREEI